MPGVVVAISFVGFPSPRPLSEGDTDTDTDTDAPVTGRSIWQNLDDPSDVLVLLRFADEPAAQDHLRRRIEGTTALGQGENPPTEVHHVEIESEWGQVLDAVPVDGVLAVTRSRADLGYGDELRERLREMLATFRQAEGYRGHILGFDPSWRDETRSFVFGTDRATLLFPDDADVEVRLYRRAA